MAVFTPVSDLDARKLLKAFGIGALRELRGIAAGIENSNFFLDTDQGRYVLTIFERLDANDLPFYLELMQHLAGRSIPCPNPVADLTGELMGRLHGKPFALVSRLRGEALTDPEPAHCAQVGDLLATMHQAADDFPGLLPNPRGRAWWEATAIRVRPHLDDSQAALLDDELARQRQFAAQDDFSRLPASAIHADLFRDNVLFETAHGASSSTRRLSGVIDFYFAGVDSWLYDLAVAANDWCIIDESGAFDPARLSALLEAYRERRAPTPAEIKAWPMMLRAAALRFWLSRLHDLHRPRPAQLISPKDPRHFERILRDRRPYCPPLA